MYIDVKHESISYTCSLSHYMYIDLKTGINELYMFVKLLHTSPYLQLLWQTIPVSYTNLSDHHNSPTYYYKSLLE